MLLVVVVSWIRFHLRGVSRLYHRRSLQRFARKLARRLGWTALVGRRCELPSLSDTVDKLSARALAAMCEYDDEGF